MGGVLCTCHWRGGCPDESRRGTRGKAGRLARTMPGGRQRPGAGASRVGRRAASGRARKNVSTSLEVFHAVGFCESLRSDACTLAQQDPLGTLVLSSEREGCKPGVRSPPLGHAICDLIMITGTATITKTVTITSAISWAIRMRQHAVHILLLNFHTDPCQEALFSGSGNGSLPRLNDWPVSSH